MSFPFCCACGNLLLFTASLNNWSMFTPVYCVESYLGDVFFIFTVNMITENLTLHKFQNIFSPLERLILIILMCALTHLGVYSGSYALAVRLRFGVLAREWVFGLVCFNELADRQMSRAGLTHVRKNCLGEASAAGKKACGCVASFCHPGEESKVGSLYMPGIRR